MAEAIPLKRGATGFEQFGTTDTMPAANVPGVTVISPGEGTGDQDNFNPTGWATADVVRMSFGTTLKAITGLAAWTNGKPKLIVNISANSCYFPPEHPDSSAANRIAGESDYILEGGGSVWAFYDDTSSRVRLVNRTFDPVLMHFSGKGQLFLVPPGSTVQADHPFLGFAQAGGSNGNTAPTSTQPGLWDIDTASSATGASSVYISKNNNGIAFFGTSHIMCGFTMYIPTLSTSAQRFMSQVSITNNPSGTSLNNNNSVGLRHDDNTNSGKWLFFSRDNAGAETTADTGITVVAGTVYRGVIAIDKARAEARLFITDGTNTYQGRITGNMPNAVLAGARAIVVKSVGTTSRIFNVAITAMEVRV